MALVRNFKADTDVPNSIALSWNQPLDFNNSTDEIIISKSITHYPSELYNDAFPTKATDSRPIEIFRGKVIVGLDTGTISVATNSLTDTSATFPTSPKLIGRLLRDSLGKIFRIVDNTSTLLILDGTPTNGKYVILADFPTSVRDSQVFQNDISTTSGVGYIKDLVQNINGSLVPVFFSPDEVANLIFSDATGTKYVVKSNTSDTLYLYENVVPEVGITSILSSSSNNVLETYRDIFNTDYEAATRQGTGLLDDQFYYYTAFSKPEGTNVAQAEYSSIDSGTTTQTSAISVKDNNFGQILYNYWPGIFRELDANEDLLYLMEVFGFQFSQLYSLINTYRLQDPQTAFASVLVPFSEQTGLPPINFTIGADTLRRVAADMISAWKLKGSKEGIALFIKIITTWDITAGTGDFAGAIMDFLPNVEALRFFDSALGITNSRLVQSSPFVTGGRFVKSLPGIVIPGFFTFREFVINIPNVALYLGSSKVFSVADNTTTMTDTANNFGVVDSLIGNFLLPNQQEVNDVFEIISNTATTITVKGIVNNLTTGGNYVVLSPLNTNRFIILNKLLPSYQPFGTKAGFLFL